MKKLIILILIITNTGFAQGNGKSNFEINSININIPVGYKINNFENPQLSLINEKNEEIIIFISKITDLKKYNKDDFLNKLVTSGNKYISWKLLSPLEKEKKLATISKGPNGIKGFRSAFFKKNRLITITTFSLTFKESYSKLLETILDIETNN